MKRSELITNMVIGAIGATGQAGLLAHTLESYPFKILASPPGRFYSSVGWALFFIAPFLSLLALYLLRSFGSPLVTAIPVGACPLLYWTMFRLTFLFSGYHYAAPFTGNDLVATSAIEHDFSNLILWLTVSGFIVGLVCGFVVWLGFRNVHRHSIA
jgi:hypothetical protein